jgi:hypothetical protein
MSLFFHFSDLFGFFRTFMAWAASIYFTIVTVQSVWGCYQLLAGGDKYTTLLRRYLLVQGLRLRFRRFWGDAVICVLLTVAFFIIWHAQSMMDQIELTMTSARAAHVQR